VAQYIEIRKAALALYRRFLEASGRVNYSPLHAARRLTLARSGKTLIFADEADSAAFADYVMFEFAVDGTTLIQRVAPMLTDLSDLDQEILKGWLNPRTSLFQITAAQAAHQRVELQDLLEPERPRLWFSDINLSRSMDGMVVRPALFSRLVSVAGLCIGSGSFFIFHPELVPGLVQSYRRKMKSVPEAERSERRFIHFYQKNRDLGEPRMVEDAS